MEIDFAKLGGPVYVGRANGAAVRAHLKLDALDTSAEQIIIRVPANTYSVNSSFFLGMFGPSISRFGSREAFFQRYDFDAPEHVRVSLEELIDRTLASRGPLAV
jgi:hypothetical protein